MKSRKLHPLRDNSINMFIRQRYIKKLSRKIFDVENWVVTKALDTQRKGKARGSHWSSGFKVTKYHSEVQGQYCDC